MNADEIRRSLAPSTSSYQLVDSDASDTEQPSDLQVRCFILFILFINFNIELPISRF